MSRMTRISAEPIKLVDLLSSRSPREGGGPGPRALRSIVLGCRLRGSTEGGMTRISPERIAQIETPLFPGEGRGPAGGRLGSGVALRYIHLSNWAPAFAGERREGMARA